MERVTRQFSVRFRANTDVDAASECLREIAPDEELCDLVDPPTFTLRLRHRTRHDLDRFAARLSGAGAVVDEYPDSGPLVWEGERPAPDSD